MGIIAFFLHKELNGSTFSASLFFELLPKVFCLLYLGKNYGLVRINNGPVRINYSSVCENPGPAPKMHIPVPKNACNNCFNVCLCLYVYILYMSGGRANVICYISIFTLPHPFSGHHFKLIIFTYEGKNHGRSENG